ncbi:Immunoglobulin-like fold protein [Orpheovirus IHUMI-LCC2]|uniref:Immunoglobulin-like fold protein n=1 Tax=Orpheovirus IHUMI-LCC2 TaxID=2023057 RepID=A0A2I2L3C7_9VIRU|nr:Immunoglobulin-like fold protein [Orpheovirus IHUMI-LCC2]SNW62034.1 Immunoglobulin-like fold protein [Orpheovirus IHUMI-LCC2]
MAKRGWNTRYAFATFSESESSYTLIFGFTANVDEIKYNLDQYKNGLSNRDTMSSPSSDVISAVVNALNDSRLGWQSPKYIATLNRYAYNSLSKLNILKNLILEKDAFVVFSTKDQGSKVLFQDIVNDMENTVVGSGNTNANNLLNNIQGNWHQLSEFGILSKTKPFVKGATPVLINGTWYIEYFVNKTTVSFVVDEITYIRQIIKNNPPTSYNMTYTIETSISFPYPITDIDNDPITYQVSIIEGVGTYTLNASHITYIPSSDTSLLLIVGSDGCKSANSYVRVNKTSIVFPRPTSKDFSIKLKSNTQMALLLEVTASGTWNVLWGSSKGTINNFIYTPPLNEYNPYGDIYEIVPFQIIDKYGKSDVYMMTVYVYPEYNEEQIVNINEDSSYSGTILLPLSRSELYNVSVVDVTDKGSWTLEENNLRFRPSPDDFGNDYFVISYIVSDLESGVIGYYTTKINVIPINDSPILIPFFDDRVEVWENSTVDITFAGFDIDDAEGTLVSVVSTYQGRGSWKLSRGENLRWTITYTPTPNQSGKNYETIIIYIKDPHGAISNIGVVFIDVKHINRPPVLQVTSPIYTLVGETIILNGNSATDVDDNILQLYMDEKYVVTTDKKIINILLNNISVTYNETGQHFLKLQVWDAESSDSKTIEIIVTDKSVIVTDTGGINTGIVIGSTIGAAVVLGLAVALITRKLAGKGVKDEYFENLMGDSNNANSNPLYEGRYTQGENAIYVQKM